jgi:single-strand DNA-binding protein
MASLNRVSLIGNIGKDPESKYLTNGDAVTNVSLATTESWKDKNTGEKVEKTEWHRLVFFKKLAEIVAEYCEKGKQIYVEGRLQTRKYEKDGVTHYSTEIVCDTMKMLGTRPRDDEGGSSAPARKPAAKPAPAEDADSGSLDEDIPF